MSRATQGVTLINLGEDEKLAGLSGGNRDAISAAGLDDNGSQDNGGEDAGDPDTRDEPGR